MFELALIRIFEVLILVLLEVGFWELTSYAEILKAAQVLILVLLEVGFWVVELNRIDYIEQLS